MAKMKRLSATPLASYSHEWKVAPTADCPDRGHQSCQHSPEGMVKIPEADFLFRVAGIEIEGFNDIGVDVQYPWEDSPRRFHEHPMHMKSFCIDKYPVTNAAVQEIPGRHPLPSQGRFEFPARLEERHIIPRAGTTSR